MKQIHKIISCLLCALPCMALAQTAIKADIIYTVSGSPIKNGVVLVKDGRRFKSDEVLNSATVFTYLTNDKKKVIEFGGHILSQRGALAVYFRMLKQYSTYSNALIIFLQKEYHLQHE